MEDKLNRQYGISNPIQNLLSKDDPYQDIYDDVSAELDVGNFTQVELFNHCLKTCKKIFDISEFKYGKKHYALPHDLIEDISLLYAEKRDYCSTKGMPMGKYDYPTSCKEFLLDDKEPFSLANLIRIMPHDNYYSDKSDNLENFKKEVSKCRKYLPNFFGDSFDVGFSSLEADKKYEWLRLIKILYDCKCECRIDLGYLQRMSLIKYNMEIPSSYQKSIKFIKERILVRSKDSEYRVSFQTIMELEKYNSAMRSLLNSFSEGIVVEQRSRHNKPFNCYVIRFIYKKIYQAVINNVDSFNLKKEDLVIDKATSIQCYAYVNFLMMDIINDDYSKFYLENFVVNIEDEVYDRVNQFLNSYDEISIAINNISKFVDKYKNDLLIICYPKKIQESDKKRKFLVRLGRHKEGYNVLSRIFNLVINKNKNSDISSREMLLLIYLYEYLSDKSILIPLYSGYMGEKKPRSLKIKELIKQIESYWNKQSSLTDEEYFLAEHWIYEQIIMVMNYLTPEIQRLCEEMKSKLFNYWKATVPLLIDESIEETSIETLIEKFIPRDELEKIMNEAIAMQKNLEN